MTVFRAVWARSVFSILILGMLAGCALPRSGPTKREILDSSVEEGGDAFIVPVTRFVTNATAVVPPLGFGEAFLNAGIVGSDTVQPGDTLGFTIWENVDDGLLAGEAQSTTTLDEVQVDGSGFIFVPYAGRIKASGNSPEAIRRIITDKLNAQTPDPQVVVRRLAGNGATVSLVGGVGGQGVYAIERPTRTLTAMLAEAGGVTIPSEIAQVTVIRGGHRGQIWLEDLYRDPRLDIALRAGDRILVEEDSRAFTALGATGGQARVTFQTQSISAIEAIAQLGGLNSNLADPTGVFVFRDESEEIAQKVLNRADLRGSQRIVYLLDLTEPGGVFEARDFIVRDGDTIYVTEAPYTQFNKILAAILGPLNSANSINQLSQDL